MLLAMHIFSFSLVAQQDLDPNSPEYAAQKAAIAQSMAKNQSVTKSTKPKVVATPSSNITARTSCIIPRDATWSRLAGNDDGSTGQINLPFTFDLYGSSYNKVWVNNNGNVTFTGPYSAYSASGFPFSMPMVAAFWGDVDTRTCGGVYYKVFPTRMVITYENVGYYSTQCGLTNTFQIVIGTANDSVIGLGQNVLLNYGDMNWTTGSASGGSGGFGGTPATVGINQGNSVNYVQIGRFNQNNSNYDGGGGANDGVHYLDFQCYSFNVSTAGNIPPSFSGLPQGNTLTLNCGETANLTVQSLGPEVNQTVSMTVNTGGLCNVTSSVTNGAVATANISITASACNTGTHTITFTSTDNGNPSETTVATLTVIVQNCNTPPVAVCQPVTVSADGNCQGTASATSFDGGSTDAEGDALTFSVSPAGPYPLGTTNVTLTVTDANGASSSCNTTVTVTDNTAPVPDNAALPVVTGECSASVTAPTATDNCAGAITGTTTDPTSYTEQGTYTITWTYDDGHGNTSTQTQTVVVKDVTAPAMNCPSDQFFCYDGSNYAIPALTASDNCNIASVSYVVSGATNRSGNGNDASGAFNVGTSTITWTVDDGNGNTSSCSIAVTVNPPISASVPDAYAVNPGGSANTIYVGYGPSTITLVAVGTGGSGSYNYQWSNGATSQSVSVGAGNYSVTVTDAAGCSAGASKLIDTRDIRCGNKNEKVIICHIPPGNTGNPQTLCIAPSAVPTHLAHGCYLGACTGTSKVSPETVASANGVTIVYPNPSKGAFDLQMTDYTPGVYQVNITDNYGRLIMQRSVNVTGKTQKLSINMHSAVPGIYNVNITGDGTVKSTRVVIRN